MMSEVYLIQEHIKDMEIKKADLINKNICVTCFELAKDFRDDVSYIDFLYYSGECQKCQDK